jgi:hypothetical protein
LHVRTPSPDHPNSRPALERPASRGGEERTPAERAIRPLIYRNLAMP